MKYKKTPYLTIEDETNLAHELGISDDQVKIWFRNEREKDLEDILRTVHGRWLSCAGQTPRNKLLNGRLPRPYGEEAFNLDQRNKLEREWNKMSEERNRHLTSERLKTLAK